MLSPFFILYHNQTVFLYAEELWATTTRNQTDKIVLDKM
jgi:hypothetical protein